MADEVIHEVVQKIGVLSVSPTNWTKELRIVSWNGRNPRYDLREWAPGDRTLSRGITLSLAELQALRELIDEDDFPLLSEEEMLMVETES